MSRAQMDNDPAGNRVEVKALPPIVATDDEQV